MNNDRKFSVTIDMITDKFKEKANQIKNYAKSWSNDVKKTTSFNTEFDINTKDYSAQIREVKSEIEALQRIYNDIEKRRPYNLQKRDLQDTEIEIEKAINKYNQLKVAQDRATKGTTNGFGKALSGMDKKLKVASRRIQRYALSLLSIRTVYSLVSKASSSYLSTDQKRAEKISNVWTALGATLVPVIDAITKALQKGVAYINVFVKALTGTDYISKASKNFTNAATSADKLKKSLAGFDEINDISNQTVDASSSSNPFDWVSDIELDPNVVTWLENVGKWLKENKDRVKKFAEAFAVAFGIGKVAKWVSNIGKLTTALGEKGLWGALNSIAIIGGISVIGGSIAYIINDVKELNNELATMHDRNNAAYEESVKQETNLNNLLVTMSSRTTNQNNQVKKMGDFWVSVTGNTQNYLNEAEKSAIANSKILDKVEEIEKETKFTNVEQLKILDSYRDQYAVNLNIISELKSQGKSTTELENMNKRLVNSMSSRVQELLDEGYTYDQINKKIGVQKGTVEEILRLANKKATITVEANTVPAKNKILSFIQNLGSKVWSFFFPNTSFSDVVRRFASLDVGTNYVPSDQMAMIHKGEAVIPKKFNSKEYFGGGNEETNQLLMQLNRTLEEKDMNAYISSEAVGKASVNYINYKNRTLGKSVI